MREIKVRVYDKDAGEMIYSDKEYDNYFFEFKDGRLCCFVIVLTAEGNLHEPPEPYCEKLDSLDQYINFKDKNGKEIYESDIVKWSHPDMENYRINEVEYDEEMICYCLGSGCMYNYDEIEIIGNKHETPELLNES